MIIQIVGLLRVPVVLASPGHLLSVVCPRALVLVVGSDHLLLHCSFIGVNGSRLRSTFFIGLRLFLELLSVLLVRLNQLYFFLRPFVV